MNLWGFALPSEAFNRAPFNWGRSFCVSFCWTVAGWEAYPLDKLCDLLKGCKRLVLKMTCRSIISSLLGWDVTSSCRQLQYLSGWCGSHKIRWSLQVVLAYTPKNQRETWKSPLEKHNHLQTSTIHAFQKVVSVAHPQKKHSHLCFDLNRQEGSKT